MIFSENKQLFGFDGMERIVAVEFSVPNQIDIFVRESDGSTSIRREEFSPFLWTSSAAIPLEVSCATACCSNGKASLTRSDRV